jgi:hypothetical protein
MTMVLNNRWPTGPMAMILATGVIALSACDREPGASEVRKEPTSGPASTHATPTPTAGVPLTATGPAESLEPDTADDIQGPASVVRIDEMSRQGDLTVKLFGTAGGDPAMNGLYTYIAFFDSVPEGWRVFRIGDFLDYRVLREEAGRIDLEISESVMNPDDGAISSRKTHLIVTWTPGPDDTPPPQVIVAPAA